MRRHLLFKVEEDLCTILELSPSYFTPAIGQEDGYRPKSITKPLQVMTDLFLTKPPHQSKIVNFRPSWRFLHQIYLTYFRRRLSSSPMRISNGSCPYFEEGILGFCTCRWPIFCIYIPSSQWLGSTTVSSKIASPACPALNTRAGHFTHTMYTLHGGTIQTGLNSLGF